MRSATGSRVGKLAAARAARDARTRAARPSTSAAASCSACGRAALRARLRLRPAFRHAALSHASPRSQAAPRAARRHDRRVRRPARRATKRFSRARALAADAAGASAPGASRSSRRRRNSFPRTNPPPRLTRFRERFERLARARRRRAPVPALRRRSRHCAPASSSERLLVGELARAPRRRRRRFPVRRGTRAARSRTCVRRASGTVSRDGVAPVYWHGERVSSTAIREALQAGDLATARGMLGRDYSISGRVVRGLGLGRQLGFPTANVNLKRLLAPVDGIFAARVSGLGGAVARRRRERRHASDDRRRHCAARSAHLRLRPRHLRRVHHRALHASGSARSGTSPTCPRCSGRCISTSRRREAALTA